MSPNAVTRQAIGSTSRHGSRPISIFSISADAQRFIGSHMTSMTQQNGFEIPYVFPSRATLDATFV
uniref:Uncharacterized protein n=1 Tax=Rhizobium rhizogenes TaxID=359 RepID=A0A7S4ZRD7_RHIRH|nr:hypothetical protein pC5.7b_420 [Rhizobium rhizogenes]